MEKYSWFQNHDDKAPFTVVHTEGEVETHIALTDTSEKAHFITAACNQFNLEQYEASRPANPVK